MVPSILCSSLLSSNALWRFLQIGNRWHAAGANENVAWLQWLLSQPKPSTGCGLSDLALSTTPRAWLDVRLAHPLLLPSMEASGAAR